MAQNQEPLFQDLAAEWWLPAPIEKRRQPWKFGPTSLQDILADSQLTVAGLGIYFALPQPLIAVGTHHLLVPHSSWLHPDRPMQGSLRRMPFRGKIPAMMSIVKQFHPSAGMEWNRIKCYAAEQRIF